MLLVLRKCYMTFFFRIFNDISVPSKTTGVIKIRVIKGSNFRDFVEGDRLTRCRLIQVRLKFR